VLGVAYKKDIDDIRESPALDVMHVLHERGARVSYADPHVPALGARDWPGGCELRSVDLTRAALASVDCAVIATDHGAFDWTMVAEAAPLVVDTRNAIGAGAGTHVFRLGAPRQAAGETADAAA
jgi:UDP-N-acetyl-D-glucosamine dehydrogenase